MSGPGWVPPPGWYPDPWDFRLQRRWDGAVWTADVGPAPTAPSALLVWEEAITPWVRRAVIVFPLLSIVVCLVSWADAASWERYFHAAKVFFDNLGQYPPPPQPKIPIASYFSWLLAAPEVVFVIWQYRAAKFARSLGYPARRSPAWGIVAYLVPIADLFIPAQALSDCFPPGHPGRRLVTKTWVLLLAVTVLQSSLIVTLALLRPLGVVLLAVTVACDVLLLLYGLRMVDAITDHHRHALGQGQTGS